ncbi:MAG: hypothetical protein KJZ85_19730 [Rhodobacteraceae bacterium]|jgi:alkylation response protein AidB-like acyl-CoA dehydrogenase|nr:hypothetical protein [Paracoccaceae bacterium]
MLEPTEEQTLLADQIARFLEAGPADWAGLAGIGLTGITVAADHGGIGGGAREAWIAARAAGAACLAQPLTHGAILPGLLLDDGAAAAALAAGRRRIIALPAAAAAEGELLAGVPWVDGAEALILAPGGAPALLDLGADRGAVTPRPLIDGMPGADIRLTPALLQSRRPLGGGAAALVRAERFERLATVAEAAGAAEAAVALTARYLTERRQFGQPLAAFQALRHRLVEAMVSAQEIHAAGLSACLAVTGDAPAADRLLAAALYKAATAGRRVAEEAVQLHGGVGVTEEFRVSHLFRRLVRLSLAFGGAPAHLARLAAA